MPGFSSLRDYQSHQENFSHKVNKTFMLYKSQNLTQHNSSFLWLYLKFKATFVVISGVRAECTRFESSECERRWGFECRNPTTSKQELLTWWYAPWAIFSLWCPVSEDKLELYLFILFPNPHIMKNYHEHCVYLHNSLPFCSAYSAVFKSPLLFIRRAERIWDVGLKQTHSGAPLLSLSEVLLCLPLATQN